MFKYVFAAVSLLVGVFGVVACGCSDEPAEECRRVDVPGADPGVTMLVCNVGGDVTIDTGDERVAGSDGEGGQGGGGGVMASGAGGAGGHGGGLTAQPECPEPCEAACEGDGCFLQTRTKGWVCVAECPANYACNPVSHKCEFIP